MYSVNVLYCKLFHRFACILNYTLHRVVLRSMCVLCNLLLHLSLFGFACGFVFSTVSINYSQGHESRPFDYTALGHACDVTHDQPIS